MALSGNTSAQNSSYNDGGAFTFDDEGEDSSDPDRPSEPEFTITNELFTGNSSYGEPGGAIEFYNRDAGTDGQGSTFNGNNSYYYGGAISFYAGDSPRVTIQNSVFVNNASGDDTAGAIYSDVATDNLKMLNTCSRGGFRSRPGSTVERLTSIAAR